MHAIRRLLIVLLVSGLVQSPVAAQPASAKAPDYAAIDAYIQAQMQAINLPGVALGIVHQDQVVYLQGYGIADPSGRAVTPQTPFWLASLSKPVTALAIMQLVEAGHIELDAPVQRYLPEFQLADARAATTITVRHLLNQTSGLSGAVGNEQFPSDAMLAWSVDQRLRELSDEALSAPAGTRFQYSNVNFVLLALMVERVSGQAFEGYVQDHIFRPLDMPSATYYRAEANPSDSATGYQHWFGYPVASTVPLPRSSNGSGGLIASASDMSHFLVAQLNEGRYGTTTVLSPAGIEAMHTPAARDGSSETYYAIGWEVETIAGLTTISHSGDHGNFHADLVLTSDGWGVVMMTNANSLWAAARPSGMPLGILSLLRGQQPPTNNGISALRIFYLGVMGIVALQIIGTVWSWVTLRRWFGPAGQRPQGWRSVGWHVVLPLVVNVLLGGLLTGGLPAVFGLSLPSIIFLYPDVGYALAISGTLASVWIIRTVVAYFALRGGKQPAMTAAQPPVKPALT